MLIKRPTDILPSEITMPQNYASRRDFMRAAADRYIDTGSEQCSATTESAMAGTSSTRAPGVRRCCCAIRARRWRVLKDGIRGQYGILPIDARCL